MATSVGDTFRRAFFSTAYVVISVYEADKRRAFGSCSQLLRPQHAFIVGRTKPIRMWGKPILL